MADTPYSNPGPFSGDLIKALQKAGIIPHGIQRVIIDCNHQEFVQIHVQMFAADGDKLMEVLAAELKGAQVIIHDKEQNDDTTN